MASLGRFFPYAAALLIAALLVFAGCKGKGPSAGEGKEVAALVNGEKVYMNDVNSEYASLSPAQKESFTKSDALSFLIEREILYQEARKQGITVTSDELDQEYNFYLLANNITGPGLEIQLEAINSSISRLKGNIMKQVMINKLFEKAIPRQFVIKHQEAEAVYKSGGFASLNISLEQAEKSIVDFLTAQRQEKERKVYVEGLKAKADVLIVAVPS